MKERGVGIAIAVLLLVSFAFLVTPAVADWHGGKALVMYRTWTWNSSDGWVQWNYKDGPIWGKFRNEFEKQGWTVDFAKHVNSTLLSNYDALFVLTPSKNIPDDEVQAIINWVLGGGQLVITQDDCGVFANKITKTFGIEFDDCRPMEINNFADHPVTHSLSKVDGATARKINVSGSSKEIGWFKVGPVKYCLLAVNDTAGEGVVVAIGDEYMWSDCLFNKADNEELLDNILAYFRQTCSVPEFTPLWFTIPVLGLLGMVFLLLRRG